MRRKCDRGHRLSVGDLQRGGRCSVCESLAEGRIDFTQPGGEITALFAALGDHVIDLTTPSDPPPDDPPPSLDTDFGGGGGFDGAGGGSDW